MIRAANITHIPAIVDLAVESVSRDPLPLKIDRAAMVEMATQMVGNPAHFIWVGEDDDGAVTSCVAAHVSRGFWFRGLQASIVLFYARRPSHGALLLRRFSRWCKERSGIKIAVFELEPGADPRIEGLLAKLGFSRGSRNMTYVRGAA
jgi:hypothetical protein